jgi:hypothetical protein
MSLLELYGHVDDAWQTFAPIWESGNLHISVLTRFFGIMKLDNDLEIGLVVA